VKPVLKNCPACGGSGRKYGTGPGLCEGGCGGSGKVPIQPEDVYNEHESNKNLPVPITGY
jgi:DnaJ-class molecular chaperone